MVGTFCATCTETGYPCFKLWLFDSVLSDNQKSFFRKVKPEKLQLFDQKEATNTTCNRTIKT